MSAENKRSNKNQSSSMENSYPAKNLGSGVLFGVGLVSFIDEAIFHQILQWHHFYDRSSTTIGLISDGFFHAFSWVATVAALFMVADLRRRKSFWLRRWFGGVLLGAGVFQLYDGLIQHKIMHLHQIRYVDNLFMYDLVWNGVAVAIIIIGIVIIFKDRSTSPTNERDPSYESP